MPRLSRSKFGAIKTVVDGITFASRLEAKRYRELRLLEHAGVITQLTLQPTYELIPAFTDNQGKRHRRTTYVGDFFYYDAALDACVEDTKGTLTREFRIKEKLFRTKYPSIKFMIVKENP